LFDFIYSLRQQAAGPEDDATLSKKVNGPRRINIPVSGRSKVTVTEAENTVEIDRLLSLTMMPRSLIRWAGQEGVESLLLGRLFCPWEQVFVEFLDLTDDTTLIKGTNCIRLSFVEDKQAAGLLKMTLLKSSSTRWQARKE
jgi:hypothetical protein